MGGRRIQVRGIRVLLESGSKRWGVVGVFGGIVGEEMILEAR